jgi:hypothetical protein
MSKKMEGKSASYQAGATTYSDLRKAELLHAKETRQSYENRDRVNDGIQYCSTCPWWLDCEEFCIAPVR